MKNNKIIKSFFCISLLILFSVYVFGQTNNDKETLNKNVRTFINLLDYLASDYHNAVENGKIKDEGEFSEMNEFAGEAISTFNNISSNVNINDKDKIETELLSLKESIQNKKSVSFVSSSAKGIKNKILQYKLIKISPPEWPSLTYGKKIFDLNCVSCHGTDGSGNGPAAANLNPKPANFLDNSLMSNISPFQIFNTVRLGINGTSMVPFDSLSDEQVWDAAFYVASLRYKNKYHLSQDSLSSLYKKASLNINLSEVSTLSDKELLTKLDSNKLALASIRLYSAHKTKSFSIEKASEILDEVLSLYKNGKVEQAHSKALAAYLEGIEPFEQQLSAVNGDLKINVENAMYKVRNDIKANVSEAVLEADITNAKSLISEASLALKDKDFSFWFAFLLSGSILLREGIEAFLIIITILGVLKSVKAKEAEKWVHGGWIVALMLGIISLFFTKLIISFGAQSRELMEGVGSLIAVIILLYIGFWLHSKTEAKKWKEFIENKIMKHIKGNNMFGLALVSFIVVFREAFETVIFLSAVNLEVSQGGKNGVYLGAGFSLILVFVLAWAAVKYAARLPIKKVFQYSALIMSVLSIVLIGKGIHALQESGYSSITFVPIKFHFSFFGIYPTVETLIGQVIVLLLTIILYRLSKRTPALRTKRA